MLQLEINTYTDTGSPAFQTPWNHKIPFKTLESLNDYIVLYYLEYSYLNINNCILNKLTTFFVLYNCKYCFKFVKIITLLNALAIGNI